MVGMSAIVWWPAFTLAVWEDIFFDDVMVLWAASTAAFVFVLVERRPIGGRLARAFVLLLPTLWLVLNFVIGETEDLMVATLDLAAIFTVLLGIPFTLWVLVRIVWPDFAAETRPGARWLIAGVVLGIAVASYILGLNQEYFLTCEDFAISGKAQPANCTPEPD